MDLCEFTEDIIIEILLRIPAKDLVIFKTVCKLWYKIISDSNFVNVHLSRSQKQIILKTYDLGNWGMDKFLSMRIDCNNNMMSTVVEKFHLNNLFPKEETVSILAGYNGLLLLQGYSSSDDDFYHIVCNLAIRQYTLLPHLKKLLPHLKKHCLNQIISFKAKCRWAMFYDSSVERYGVFAICGKHVNMLTSGDKQWKYHILPKHDAYFQLASPPVFDQRELHWLACHMYEHCDKYICSLDVGNMDFKMIKLPTSEAERNLIFLSSENKESLCVATVFQDHLDVWGLEDKGNNPWTKKTSVTLQSLSNIPNFWVGMCIVGINEDVASNDGIALKLIIPQGDKLLYHDLKSRELKQIANIKGVFQVTRPGQFHVDTLVSWHPTKPLLYRAS